MTAVLSVRPGGFLDAAMFVGANAADGLETAWSSLLYRLEPLQGMAGTDDAGTAWGDSYDVAADGARLATARLVSAYRQTAGLLEQTGLNYANAEQLSVAGAVPSLARGAQRWLHDVAGGVAPAPPGAGAAGAAPHGWSIVAHAVGRLWPDGHQDELHGAADAWRAAADEVEGLAPVVGSAARLMLCQTCPEADDAFTAVDGLIPHLYAVAAGYRQLARACDAYAGHVDTAHHAIIEELKSFLEWTAGIEATSALFSVITVGLSEVAGQVGEGAEIARAARVIKRVLDVLKAATTVVRAEIVRVGAEFTALCERLAPVLRIELAEARLVPVGRLEMAMDDPALRLANRDVLPPIAPTPTAEAVANLEQAEAEVADLPMREAAKPPVAENTKLRNIIRDLHKGVTNSERIGDGTTADAIRYELRTGREVAGKRHVLKGRESLRGLSNLIRSNVLSDHDLAIAKSLAEALRSALGGS